MDRTDIIPIVKFPSTQDWTTLLQRPVLEKTALDKSVAKIIAKVRKGGDKTLKKLTKELDGVSLKSLEVSEAEIEQAVALVPEDLKAALRVARDNITAFHESQLREEPVVETMPGVRCWRRSVPIEKVGLYIPGGSAPLFSTVLMLAIPAMLAGCKEIVLCTPPAKDGSVNPVILFAARSTGVTKIFKVGGAQAIAAMGYGTESIPRVYKIFGPGNQYVTTAKQLLQSDSIAIDMPAGPSEVCVLADETANPSFIAADLISQAEHGADSQAVLVTTSISLAEKVVEALSDQLIQLPRQAIAKAALSGSRIIVPGNMDDAISFVNLYAAEHLIIACAGHDEIGKKITNAGSVFLGHYSPESVGDYASGTNHTLPTNGYARVYSGVSVDSFVKKITYQQLSREGLEQIGRFVEIMASAEGLDGHARAVSVRTNAEAIKLTGNEF